MDETNIPIPDYLPTSLAEPLPDLAAQVLELYRRAVTAEARLTAEQERTERQLAAQQRAADEVMAALAAPRFELARLCARLLPRLEVTGLAPEARALSLFARAWDQELTRHGVEVCDLSGQELSDELAQVVEVEAAVADPAVRELRVRQTLVPLVKLGGRVVGVARVISSAPPAAEQTGQEESA